jgi:hemerythrin-like domain-containing protein
LVRPTICERIGELRCEHSQLLQTARELANALYATPELPDFSARREEVAQFLAMLRRHHAKEVDVVFESFWVDLGVGD